jgi:quercetin dioxygenase-like cupin family protein
MSWESYYLNGRDKDVVDTTPRRERIEKFRGRRIMIIKSAREVKGQAVATGVVMQWVISEKDGAENFYMRIIHADPGTEGPPFHRHPYEHEMYILEGEGTVLGEEGERSFRPGDVIYIPPDEPHQLKHPNGLRFI